jgi:hypothetical protein
MGMFDLKQEAAPQDLSLQQLSRQAGTRAGRAIGGMLGIESPQDKINNIVAGLDMSDKDSVAQAITALMPINPDMAMALKDRYIKSKGQDIKLAKMENEPALAAKWMYEEGPATIRSWATEQLSMYGVTADQIEGLSSDSDVTNLITRLVKEQDIEKGAAGKLIAAFKRDYKAANQNYMNINALSFKNQPKQQRSLSSIKGRGERIAPKLAPKAPTPQVSPQAQPVSNYASPLNTNNRRQDYL